MRGEAISVLSLEGRYHKYDIVLKAIKLISPRPDYDNLFITYFNTCAFMALSGSEFGTATNRAGQKTISATKSDISDDIVFMSPCYRPDKGTSM